MNALLYAANTSSQVLTAGQNINFGLPVRRYGKNIQISGGNNITINGEGYYPIDANVTFQAGANGTAVLQVYENGVAIPGATASIQTAANTVYSLEVPTVVRIRCCEEKVITAAITGIGTTTTNAAIRIEKA